MSTVNIDLHSVSRISVSTRKCGPHDSIKEDYIVHNVVLHCKDRLGQPMTVDLNLYGEWGVAEVPFMFGGCVVETGKVEEDAQ